MSIHVRINAMPGREELDQLHVTVGWPLLGGAYPAALHGCSVTASGWTDDGRLVAWTSLVSDDVRHAFLLDVIHGAS